MSIDLVQSLGWLMSFLSIVGAIMNARGIRYGFIIWIITNAGWIIFDIYMGVYEQIPVWVVFTFTSLYGFIYWGKKKKAKKAMDRWARFRRSFQERFANV